MNALHKALGYCARAYWALAVVYLALPFLFREKVGSTAFAATFFGAIVLAVAGLLLYGSSRYVERGAEGSLSRRLLWGFAGVAWLAVCICVLLAVWLVIEQLRLK
jgi:hypothetical protein